MWNFRGSAIYSCGIKRLWFPRLIMFSEVLALGQSTRSLVSDIRPEQIRSSGETMPQSLTLAHSFIPYVRPCFPSQASVVFRPTCIPARGLERTETATSFWFIRSGATYNHYTAEVAGSSVLFPAPKLSKNLNFLALGCCVSFDGNSACYKRIS